MAELILAPKTSQSTPKSILVEPGFLITYRRACDWETSLLGFTWAGYSKVGQTHRKHLPAAPS